MNFKVRLMWFHHNVIAIFGSKLICFLSIYLSISKYRAQCFWGAIGFSSADIAQIEDLWEIALPVPAWSSPLVQSTVITGLLWNLWECRNALIFNQVDARSTVVSLLFNVCSGWPNRPAAVRLKKKVYLKVRPSVCLIKTAISLFYLFADQSSLCMLENSDM